MQLYNCGKQTAESLTYCSNRVVSFNHNGMVEGLVSSVPAYTLAHTLAYRKAISGSKALAIGLF